MGQKGVKIGATLAKPKAQIILILQGCLRSHKISVAVHAVSDSLLGPYVDKGLCWPEEQGGKGHNVTALTLPDGRYAVVISETRPCEVHVSKSLDGPWEHLGTITVEGEPRWRASNVSIFVRP